MARPIAETQRVAIGRGARHSRRADAAAGAADIFDHDRLTERGLHVLGQDARQRSGGAARRERHDNGDRPRRIGLRPSDARRGRQRGSARGQMQEFAAVKFHSQSLHGVQSGVDGGANSLPPFPASAEGQCRLLAEPAAKADPQHKHPDHLAAPPMPMQGHRPPALGP